MFSIQSIHITSVTHRDVRLIISRMFGSGPLNAFWKRLLRSKKFTVLIERNKTKSSCAHVDKRCHVQHIVQAFDLIPLSSILHLMIKAARTWYYIRILFTEYSKKIMSVTFTVTVAATYSLLTNDILLRELGISPFSWLWDSWRISKPTFMLSGTGPTRLLSLKSLRSKFWT